MLSNNKFAFIDRITTKRIQTEQKWVNKFNLNYTKKYVWSN